ncbi:MAG: hypothetical protein LBO00_10255 [Zoogloeaceae bacterium]|jgi:hypothetical protein|nr:hypothetical protein [Zoogloeaceae bacterium]
MITVVFRLDLTACAVGHCSHEENTAILAIQKSKEENALPGSSIQYHSEACVVLQLPDHEQAFGQLVYWCNYGKIPYKTLWLNDVAEWREGGAQ